MEVSVTRPVPRISPPGNRSKIAGRVTEPLPLGWPSLLASGFLHCTVFATLLWLTMGGQGNDGFQGEALATEVARPTDTVEFTMTLPAARARTRVEPQNKPQAIRSLPTFGLNRILAKAPSADLQVYQRPGANTRTPALPDLPQDLHSIKPTVFKSLDVTAADLRKALASTSQSESASARKVSRSDGKGSRTQTKASGNGANGGTGSATLLTQLPRPLREIAPSYPLAAKNRHAQGTATVLVTVNANGRVSSCTIASSTGHPDLDDAALAVVRKWRFSPALRASTPVTADVRVRVTFRLAA